MRTLPRSVLALMIFGCFLGSSRAAAITDLAPGAGYVSSVDALVQARIVTGRSDSDGTYTGLFRPNDVVTLAEMLKMSLLAAKLPFPTARVPSNVSAQGTWAAGYVHAAELRRFAVFRDNRLDVFRAASRGEVAQTLNEAFRNSAQSARTEIAKGDTGRMTRGEFAIVLARLLPYAPTPSTVSAPVITQAAASSAPAVTESSSVVSAILPPPPVLEPSPPPPMMMDATHRLVASSANLRSGPSTEYRIVRSLFNGELVKILSRPNDAWAQVQLSDGATGFLIVSSVAPLQSESTPASSGPTSTVTSAVNVRRKPDFAFPAFDSVPAGTPLTILDDADPFFHVRLPDGREGYIAKKYVK